MNNRPICAQMTTSSSARSSAIVRRTALAPPAPPTCRCSRFPHKQQCSAVTCASRLVTASNRTFSDGGGGGGDRAVSLVRFLFSKTVPVLAFSTFSGPSASAFGVIREDEVRTSQLAATDQRAEGSADAQPRASPKPIRTRACPEGRERHRGPPLCLYMQRLLRGQRQRHRATHQGCRGKRLPCVRCLHLDRGFECMRCAQDRFVICPELAVSWP